MEYLAERLPLRLALPVPALLALAASPTGRPVAFASDAGFALLMFAQFRIWDDLADRPRDCAAHPERTLCRVGSAAPVTGACAALGLANAALATYRGGANAAVAALISLDAALGAWYLLRHKRTAAGDHLLLAKYPAMVLIVAGARVAKAPITLAVALGAVYLGACLYEVWHDPASPLSRKRLVVAAEALSLLAAVAVLLPAHFPRGRV